MEPVHDIRLLLAILAPLIGAGLVLATGKRPTVHETCSFIAAATHIVLTASMIPDIHRVCIESRAGRRGPRCYVPPQWKPSRPRGSHRCGNPTPSSGLTVAVVRPPSQ